MNKKPELLMPAGSLETLKTAVLYGADAVYLGGEVLSLRAKAKNFTMPEIKEGIRFAHDHGVKVYVAANIFAHNGDMRAAMKFFLLLNNYGPDALILSDPPDIGSNSDVLFDFLLLHRRLRKRTCFGPFLLYSMKDGRKNGTHMGPCR